MNGVEHEGQRIGVGTPRLVEEVSQRRDFTHWVFIELQDSVGQEKAETR